MVLSFHFPRNVWEIFSSFSLNLRRNNPYIYNTFRPVVLNHFDHLFFLSANSFQILLGLFVCLSHHSWVMNFELVLSSRTGCTSWIPPRRSNTLRWLQEIWRLKCPKLIEYDLICSSQQILFNFLGLNTVAPSISDLIFAPLLRMQHRAWAQRPRQDGDAREIAGWAVLGQSGGWNTALYFDGKSGKV